MATPVEQELRRAVADLDALRVRWALVGGLAISVRSVPRFTKDLDFAVAVVNDSEAEDVVLRLRGRGYQPVEVLEQDRRRWDRDDGESAMPPDPVLADLPPLRPLWGA